MTTATLETPARLHPPLQPTLWEAMVVDNFAGGGGASLGLEWGTGRIVDVAINHDPAAIRMHTANHPHTRHLQDSVFAVDPRAVCGGRPVAAAWFSPDCTHFSRAKGSKPLKKAIRGLAWVVLRWAGTVRPERIFLENVPEFLTWGPLNRNRRPIRSRRGETFKRWLWQLAELGYDVEHRVLDAADYGAPTHRKRLFVIARRDGRPICWPEPTHGLKRPTPWRTAAECIDWTLPCPSIFDRKRPLAEKTMRRIALGVKRFILENPRPFIVRICQNGSNGGHVYGVDEPLGTIVSKNEHCLVTANLIKHYGGVVGTPITQPTGTITAKDHHSLMCATLTKFYGTAVGADLDAPLHTITGGGQKYGLVAAFMIKYYGCGIGQNVGEPMHTVVSKDRYGLVTVSIENETWVLADIGLRMLTPRELARAQGFPDDYVLTGTKSQQVARIGNSVPPPVAAAVVRANMDANEREFAAA